MLAFVAIALVLGLVAGFALGGRISNLRALELRAAPVLFVAMLIALAPLLFTIASGLRQVLQVLSMLGVLVFLALNIRAARGVVRAGFAIMLSGWLLNFIPIVSNGGMPLSDWAWRQSGQPGVPTPGEGGFFKIVRAKPGMWFRPLGDVIPIRPLGQVISVGDILLIIGIGVVIASAMRARTQKASAVAV